jgi:hypothetical protein
MSRKDRDRLKVLHEVRKRHITQVQAGKELAISPRWVRELLRRMKARGRPGGGARVAGEAIEPAAARGHEGAGGEAVCSAEASTAMA